MTRLKHGDRWYVEVEEEEYRRLVLRDQLCGCVDQQRERMKEALVKVTAQRDTLLQQVQGLTAALKAHGTSEAA